MYIFWQVLSLSSALMKFCENELFKRLLCLKFWRPYVLSNFFIATIFIHSLLTMPFVLARDLQRYMSKNWDLQFTLAYAWHGSRNLTIYNILYAGLLGRWDKRLVVQASDVPSIFFFIISYSLSALKTLYFHFCNFIKEMKKKIERVFAKNFARSCEKKNNTWNIRCLVD